MLTDEALNAVYHTNLREAGSYIRTYIGVLPLAESLFLLCLAVLLLIRSARLPVGRFVRAEYGALFAVTLLLALETRDTSSEYLVVSSAVRYHAAIKYYRAAASQRRARISGIQATRTRKEPETALIVIGESTNRNHMSLYGYYRDTTPKLGRLARNLAVVTDAISCDRFTEVVLEKALTVANVDNHLSFADPSAYSLLDVLHAAGIRVYWVSNQNRMGLWDNHTALLSEGADSRTFVSGFIGESTAERPDEAVFPAVRKALADTAAAKVIFVHLMGTHFRYSDRYPAAFSRYRGTTELAERPSAATDEYDNAVLYNDYVVSTLIDELRLRGGSTSLLYFSDHGESTLGRTRDQLFVPAHVEIPMLFWFSANFRAIHSTLTEVLSANSRRRFMTDDVFDVALDLVGVETNLYSPQRSLFRREYVERNRRTLSGRLDYDGYPDPIIRARNNMARVAARFPRLAQKIYVSSGPTKSSLGQAIGVFPSVALDVVFDEATGTFDVAQSGIGLTLGGALEFLRTNGTDTRMLLRLGNVGEGGAARAVADLVKLEEKYQFRERVTLVAAYGSGALRSLARLGFATAFTTPEGRSVDPARAAGTAGGSLVPIVVMRSAAGLGGRENSERAATAVNSSDAAVVECGVDPSDETFVNSMAKLSEVDTKRTIAIVVRAPSRFDGHF